MNPYYLIFASDHAGFELKNQLQQFIKQDLSPQDHNLTDIGPFNSQDSCDYPDYAQELTSYLVNTDPQTTTDPHHDIKVKGILICGTGIGMSMAANRVPGIRCALCLTPEMAQFARQHNDANVLALGARITNLETAKEILRVFCTTPFEGGRHQHRIDKLDSNLLFIS